MALVFNFYSDAALTTPVPPSLSFFQDAAAPAAEDKIIYFGSTNAAKIIKAASDPGVAQIVLSVADAGVGSGSPAADVKLALSAGGLATATGGAALNLGTQVAGGVANAVAIHLRVLDSTGVSAVNTDLSLTTNNLREY